MMETVFSGKWGKLKKGIIFFLMFIGVFFVSNRLDNDLWFLMNGGRYVLTQGLPYIEPFTIHEGMHFVMQQWLSGVVFWSVYHMFGPVGIVVLMSCIDACIIYVLFLLYMVVSNRNFLVSTFLAAVVGIFCSMTFICSRPQIFSALLLLVEVLFLEKYSRQNKICFLYPLPALSVFLINMHAALWPMILVLLLPFVLDAVPLKGKKLFFSEQEVISLLPLLICMVLMVVAAFINPYGMEAMTYTSRSYGYELINRIVREMQPSVVTGLFGKIMFFYTIFLSICYAKIKTPLRYVLTSLGTGYMAFSSVRNVFLFVLLGLFPLAYIFRNIRFEQVEKTSINYRKYWFRNVFICLIIVVIGMGMYQKMDEIWEDILQMSFLGWTVIILLVGLFCAGMVYQVKDILTESKIKFQNQAVILSICLVAFQVILLIDGRYNHPEFEPKSKPAIDYLLERVPAEQIILWTDYFDGNYAEFRGIKCYIDARAEVFLPENNWQRDVFQEYVDVEEHNLYYKDVLQQYAFNYLLVEKSDFFYLYLMQDADYKLIYDEGDFRIFEKK